MKTNVDEFVELWQHLSPIQKHIVYVRAWYMIYKNNLCRKSQMCAVLALFVVVLVAIAMINTSCALLVGVLMGAIASNISRIRL